MLSMPSNPPSQTPSYISLFSSGGIGDFGFKNAGFHCVASAELLSRRLEIQRVNEIAAPEDLICGDLELPSVFQAVIDRAKAWTENSKQPITTILATPPCQGMSVANHKKGDELGRNSLVVRSIQAVLEVKPLTFVFENVPAFMKTVCTGLDGVDRPIGDEIDRTLGGFYEFYSTILPLEEFGSPSKRKRSITIGVRNDVTWASPLELFPDRSTPPTLRELIGHLPPLSVMGERYANDRHHAFRRYQDRMRPWIQATPEGHSAFDNELPEQQPHRVINGQRVPNARKNGDKYRRVPWDTVAPCVHTRNDILASQNTVHPSDDRVFSVRELMLMMGLPKDFRWFDNESSATDSVYTQHDTNIRQCLGEAVPYPVAHAIATKIHKVLWTPSEFRACKPKLRKSGLRSSLIQTAAYRDIPTESKKKLAAFYTQPLTAFSLVKAAWEQLKNSKRRLRVLEPSSGGGTFVASLVQLASLEKHPMSIVSIDIDRSAIEFQKRLFAEHTPESCDIQFRVGDYLDTSSESFDLIIGNPPFGRKPINPALPGSPHKDLSMRFVSRSLGNAKYIAFVLPKALLHAESYGPARQEILENSSILRILDYGEVNFPDIKVETVGVLLSQESSSVNPSQFFLKSWPFNTRLNQSSDACFDEDFPSWVIYRDQEFDEVLKSLSLGRFDCWRDRSISRTKSTDVGTRVIRGRNLQDQKIVMREDDYFVTHQEAQKTLDTIDTKTDGCQKFLAPNLSYKPRLVHWTHQDGVPDGSAAVLYTELSEQELENVIRFCNSVEFERFFRVACNFATRSINLDRCLVYWWGIPKIGVI